MEQEELITRKDLTEILKVTIQTIRNFERAGMPVETYVGDRPRYKYSEVKEWLDNNKK